MGDARTHVHTRTHARAHTHTHMHADPKVSLTHWVKCTSHDTATFAESCCIACIHIYLIACATGKASYLITGNVGWKHFNISIEEHLIPSDRVEDIRAWNTPRHSHRAQGGTGLAHHGSIWGSYGAVQEWWVERHGYICDKHPNACLWSVQSQNIGQKVRNA